MSFILVKWYNGDAAEYSDKEDNKGDLVKEQHFSDGEELMAASFIIDLMDSGKHFDVRQWIN